MDKLEKRQRDTSTIRQTEIYIDNKKNKYLDRNTKRQDQERRSAIWRKDNSDGI